MQGAVGYSSSSQLEFPASLQSYFKTAGKMDIWWCSKPRMHKCTLGPRHVQQKWGLTIQQRSQNLSFRAQRIIGTFLPLP